MRLFLGFADSISEAYRKKLQTFSDNFLAKGINENRPPALSFAGMDQENFYRIEKLWQAYDDRYGE